MRVVFYGQLAERIGARHLTLDDATLSNGAKLRDFLADAHPQAADILAHNGTRLLLNDEITDWEVSLEAAHNIAIIPVVSGG